MTRTYLRELAVQLTFMSDFAWNTAEELEEQLFASDYYKTLKKEFNLYEEFPNKRQRAYITGIVAGVVTHRDELNDHISRYSNGWKLERISRMCRAVMQVAMYEILYVEDVPANVAVSEAVELVRRYEDEDAVAFVNGLLGSFVRGLDN